ncbi:MAG: acylphosphatase [Sedimentisphaerales bacterium]|nr:acylphosphatase [Sedimentisphaerales bacterium]
MIRKRVTYSGRVQGVGFRYTVRLIAANYAVTGYVSNLSNGKVEMIVEGQTAVVQAFMDRIEQEMAGYIHNTSVQDECFNDEFDSFSIQH